MTDYYVDAATGNDTNAGTTGVPWKHLSFALQKGLTSSDRLFITNTRTTPFRPVRGSAGVGDGGTVYSVNSAFPIIGNGTEVGEHTINCSSVYSHLTTSLTITSPVKAFISGSFDISHGATKLIESNYNGDMDSWTDNTTPHLWTQTQTSGSVVAQETTVVDTAGGSAAKLDRTAGSTGTCSIQHIFGLFPSTTYVINLRHREVVDGTFARPRVTIRNLTGSSENGYYWNNSTQAWQSGFTDTDTGSGNRSTSAYASITPISFLTPADTGSQTTNNFVVEITNSSDSGTVYIDNITLTSTATIQWVQHSGTTYYLVGVAITPGNVCACTSADWTAYGVMALQEYQTTGITDAAGVVALRHSYWFDSATDRIYINTGGPDIADMHVEIPGGGNAYALLLSGATAQAQNLQITGCQTGCRTTNDSVVISDCVSNGSFLGFDSVGVAPTIKDSIAYFCDDGFESTSASSNPKHYRCTSFYNWDDGFQGTGSADYECYSCVAVWNGFENSSDNSGFVCEGVNSGMELHYCTAAYNAGPGIKDAMSGASTRVFNASISYGNNLSGTASYDLDDGSGVSTGRTITDILYGTTNISPAPAGSNGNEVFTEGFITNKDFRLVSGSAAWKSGGYKSEARRDVRGRPRTPPYSSGAYEPTAGDQVGVARTARS